MQACLVARGNKKVRCVAGRVPKGGAVKGSVGTDSGHRQSAGRVRKNICQARLVTAEGGGVSSRIGANDGYLPLFYNTSGCHL